MTKTHGRSQAVKGFRRAHRLIGNPTLSIVPPIPQWELPVGVSYNAHHDRFLDGSDLAVDVDWQTQTMTTVDFVPNSSRVTVNLGVGGMGFFDMTRVTLLWADGMEAQIKNAWGVVIGETLFRVANVSVVPLGVPAPYAIEVSLRED